MSRLSRLALLLLFIILSAGTLTVHAASEMNAPVASKIVSQADSEASSSEVKVKPEDGLAEDNTALDVSPTPTVTEDAVANAEIDTSEEAATVIDKAASPEVSPAAVAAPVVPVAEKIISESPVSTPIVTENAAESSAGVTEVSEGATLPEATVIDKAASPEISPAAVVAPVVPTAEKTALESPASNSVIEEKTLPVESPADASVTGVPGNEEAKIVVPAAAIVVDERAPMSVEDKSNEAGEMVPVPPESVLENPFKVTNVEFFAGTSFMNFSYTEYDTNGAWLDDESGLLPGLLFGGTLYWTNWYASLELDYYFADVKYQGQTQSTDPALAGLPINSRSDTDIFDTTAVAGYKFSALTVYGGVGYYFWRRNIRPTMTANGLSVAGILEFYSWTYALFGLDTPVVKNENFQINLDIRATKMLDANMQVDFQGFGGYDNATLNLGEDWGLRLALPLSFRLQNEKATIIVEPYYLTWNLNRSNIAELTINGTGTGSGVVEPQSETRNYGISVYVRLLM